MSKTARRPTNHASPIEAQLETRARQQEAVASLGQLALTADDVQVLMDEAARRVAQTFGTEFSKVLELLPDGQTFRLRAGAGWPPGVVGSATVSAGADAQAGVALLAGEPVLVRDLRKEKRFPGSELLRRHGVVSGLSVVISGSPAPFGVLGVHSTAPREFSTEDVHLLQSVANVLAAAVRNRQATQALRDSEARMRAILDTAVDGIITIDSRGIMESVNPAAERMFGYPAPALVGRNVSMLMPEPFRSEHDAYVRRYLETGQPRIIGIGREVVGRRKDGSTFPVDLAVSEFVLEGRLMFAGLLHDVTDRRRMERQILEATAEEQRRIGSDLHDGLCQQLAGVAFALEVLGRKLAARAAPETETLGRIAGLVDQAITQARDLARGLQPVALDAAGLDTALAELARKAELLFHVTCIYERQGEPSAVACDGETASHLYRIAQEAISNAVKHAKARTIEVDLAADINGLRLTICDDGTGMPARPPATGIGLQTMAYRARVIGGTLSILPAPGGGTVVSCSVPLAPASRIVRSIGANEVAEDGKKGTGLRRQRTKGGRRATGGGPSPAAGGTTQGRARPGPPGGKEKGLGR